MTIQLSHLLRTAFAYVIVVISGCADTSSPLPSPPDIAPSLDRFNAPAGQLTPATAAALGEDALSLVDDLNYIVALGVALGDVFTELENSVDKDQDANETTEDGQFGLVQHPLTVQAGLFIRARYICGPSDDISADRHGLIDLYGQMVTGGFDPLFWGNFLGCLLAGESDSTVFDGRVVTTIPSDAQPGTFIDYQGTISKNQDTREFDLQLNIEDDRIDVVRRVLNEDFVVRIVADTPLQLSVVDCVGRWSCDMETRRCGLESADGVCTPELQEVTW